MLFIKYAINHNLNVVQHQQTEKHNRFSMNEYEKKSNLIFSSNIYLYPFWFAHSFSIPVHLIFYFRFPFKMLSSVITFLCNSFALSPSLCSFVCALKCMSDSWCKLFKNYPTENEKKKRANSKRMSYSNHPLLNIEWNQILYEICNNMYVMYNVRCTNTYCWMWIFNYILEIEMKTDEYYMCACVQFTILVESWTVYTECDKHTIEIILNLSQATYQILVCSSHFPVSFHEKEKEKYKVRTNKTSHKERKRNVFSSLDFINGGL